MSVLSDFKVAIAGAKTIEVTNHYIKREDHSAFGTTRRRVDRWNSAGFYSAYDKDGPFEIYRRPQRTPWPKASQIIEEIGPDGKSWKIFGGGASQGPFDLFLTIRVVETR